MDWQLSGYSIWRVWSFISGIALAALLIFSAGMAFFASHPVSVHSNAVLLTPKLKLGEPLEFTVSVDRRRPCPGYITDLYTRINKPSGTASPQVDKTQVVSSRLIATTEVRYTPRLLISLLPPSRPDGGTAVGACPQ